MIRITKIGGSLLDWPQSRAAIRQWLSTQPRPVNVIIVGGGALAEAIRKADEQFALGEERSHWLCIDVLSITARILAAAMPEFRLVASYAELQSEIAKKCASGFIFDP